MLFLAETKREQTGSFTLGPEDVDDVLSTDSVTFDVIV